MPDDKTTKTPEMAVPDTEPGRPRNNRSRRSRPEKHPAVERN